MKPKKLPKTTKDGSKIFAFSTCSSKNVMYGVVETKKGIVKPVMWDISGSCVNRINSNLNIEI